MAYKIVEILKNNKNDKLLKFLSEEVNIKERIAGKKHQVFNSSFDVKAVYSEKFLIQKLDYMHHNPVSEKWNLVSDFTEYIHSSGRYYELGEQGIYEITDYHDIF